MGCRLARSRNSRGSVKVTRKYSTGSNFCCCRSSHWVVSWFWQRGQLRWPQALVEALLPMAGRTGPEGLAVLLGATAHQGIQGRPLLGIEGGTVARLQARPVIFNDICEPHLSPPAARPARGVPSARRSVRWCSARLPRSVGCRGRWSWGTRGPSDTLDGSQIDPHLHQMCPVAMAQTMDSHRLTNTAVLHDRLDGFLPSAAAHHFPGPTAFPRGSPAGEEQPRVAMAAPVAP